MLNSTRILCTLFLLILSVKVLACERCGVFAFKHNEDSIQFVNFGKSNFNFGFNSGQHPNFVDYSGRMNFFAGYQGDVELFGTSFSINSRISTEKYRSGRPSFFQVAYNPFVLKRKIQKDYQLELDSLNSVQKKNQDSLYQLEGSSSYLQMQKHEAMVILKEQLRSSLSKYIVKKLKPLSIDTNSIQIPDTSRIPTFSSQKELDLYIDKILNNKVPIDSTLLNVSDLQNLKELNQINGKLETINSSISTQKELISSCASQIASTQGKIDDFKSWNSKSFIEGIKKIDLGMGVLSQGGMSNNSIPIQGIHVAGEYRNYFYDLSAGLTIPNQLFSSSIFDQVNQNTNTLFNLTSFNQINTTRFISSAVIGKGNREKSFISLESYYSGRSLEAIRTKKQEPRFQTENISFGFGSISKLRFLGSIGTSFKYGDSLKPGKDNLAANGKLSYHVSKTHSDFVFQSKYVGLRYDGFSQGIYTVGFIHNDFSWNQKFGKLFFMKTTVFNDRFLPRSVTAKSFETKGVSNDINLRLSSTFHLNMGSSWIYSSGNDSLRTGWNPLLKAGYNYNPKKHGLYFVSSGSFSQMHVLSLDSNLNIVNSSIKVGLESKLVYFGIKGTYQNFKGVDRMFGEHWFIQPEISLNFKGRKTEFQAKCQGTYSISKQFGEQYGGKINILATPSEYFSWAFSMQKWLKNDAVYFLADNPNNLRGYFLEFKMILHLNVNK